MRIETVWTQHREIARCEERDRLLDSGPFPAALRSAIDVRSLDLGTLSVSLGARGTPVSPSTLSAWQSGTRSPRRGASLTALDELETLLDVPAGALRRLLGSSPPPRQRSFLTTDPAHHVGILNRISHHDRLCIGPLRAPRSLLCEQVLQAETDGADRWVMVLRVRPDHPLPGVAPVRHCRLGHVLRRPETGTMIVEMFLDRALRRGETVITEHEIVAAYVGPATSFERRFSTQAREFVLEVDFDPRARPDRCLRVQQERGRVPRLDDVPLGPGPSLRAVGLDFGPGMLGFRWEWPGPLLPA